MSRLILIAGTMGVGTSTVGRALNRILPRSVMVDGDWVWAADPFILTPETKSRALENIAMLLDSHLATSAYSNVILTWVMDSQVIIDEIVKRLDLEGHTVHVYALTASPEAIRARFAADPDRDSTSEDDALSRLEKYAVLDATLVDTTDVDPQEVASRIAREVEDNEGKQPAPITIAEVVSDRPLTRSRFTPWPIPDGADQPYFPPGLFEVDCGHDIVPLWFDPAWATDILRLAESTPPWGGTQFAIVGEPEVAFHATWFGEPYENRSIPLARMIVSTGHWQTVNTIIAEDVTKELARLISDHAHTPCPRIKEGQTLIDAHDIGAVVHHNGPGQLYRFIEHHTYTDWDTDAVLGRLFTVITPSAEPWDVGVTLAVTPTSMTLSYRSDGSEFTRPLTGTEIPKVIRDLHRVLWNNGEPLTPISRLRAVD